MQQPSGVQSLDRAFALLELLCAHPGGMHLTELAARRGLHKSTAHRLLASLAALGYVKNGGDGKYLPTLKLFEISGGIVEDMDVMGIAKPFLGRLRDGCGEAVHLVVRDQGDIVYIYKTESLSNAYRMFSRIGTRRAMYCTAAGKSILASLPDDEVRTIWEQSDIKSFTPHTIVTLDALMEDLSAIRERGYALDNEENEPGVRCIAASLHDYTGACGAAFSISAPAVRMPDERIRELAGAVLAAKGEISAELGYRGAF